LLQALSEELLKLKSASQNYEETKEHLQKMCESVDKVSLTHQKLTDNIRQVIAEMEKANLENKKTQEFMLSQIGDEIKKDTDKIHHDNANQTKSLRLLKALVAVGIVLEAVIIILMFLF